MCKAFILQQATSESFYPEDRLNRVVVMAESRRKAIAKAIDFVKEEHKKFSKEDLVIIKRKNQADFEDSECYFYRVQEIRSVS